MYRKQTDAACPTKKDKTEHNFLTESITLQHSKDALYSEETGGDRVSHRYRGGQGFESR